MQVLVIHKIKHTPEVIIDSEKNEFSIRGFSRPENVESFFEQIYIWISKKAEAVSRNPHNLKIIIDLEYFNSSSLIHLLQFLTRCVEIKGNESVGISWFYDNENDDSLEVCRDFAELLKVHIKKIRRINNVTV